MATRMQRKRPKVLSSTIARATLMILLLRVSTATNNRQLLMQDCHTELGNSDQTDKVKPAGCTGCQGCTVM